MRLVYLSLVHFFVASEALWYDERSEKPHLNSHSAQHGLLSLLLLCGGCVCHLCMPHFPPQHQKYLQLIQWMANETTQGTQFF